MFDKITDLTRSCVWMKKTCMFFVMFAVSMTVIGGVFGTNAGDGELADVAVANSNPASMTTSEESVAKMTETASGNRDIEKLVIKTDVRTVDDEDRIIEIVDDEETLEKRSVFASEAEPEAIEAVSVKAHGAKKADKSGAIEGFAYLESVPMSYELQEYTYRKCIERGLEYELVLAIMWRESRFDTNAVNVNSNGTRDNGIMQINDVNKSWLYNHYGISNLMDPYQNIDAGTAMLSLLENKYGIHGAMLAYQYGEGGMSRRVRAGQTTSHAVEAAYSQRDYYRQLV